MTTFICLLRGINVGGKRPVKMEALRALFEEAGGQKVRTYIQSGNVIFALADEELPVAFEATLSQKIENCFGFLVPLLFISVVALEEILAGNPFLREEGTDSTFLHVTLLKEAVPPATLEAYEAKSLPAENARLFAACAYLYCPEGYHKAKGGNEYWERVTGKPATTRNWKTLQQLVAMGRG